jgi:hypothetical protein
MAPIAQDPFVPVVLTPEKLITIVGKATDCDDVAVAVTPANGAIIRGRHISTEPVCALVRLTSV